MCKRIRNTHVLSTVTMKRKKNEKAKSATLESNTTYF